MKTFIVIPTYNEKENIERLIIEIFDLRIDDLFILVIDDNSPDGTADIVKGLMKNYHNLYLIKRPAKLGLGSAYREGFTFALRKRADFIFEMDADFSHQPKYIITILAELSNNDLVIGSRYVRGGGVENWPWWRQALSRIANFYTQLILNLKVKDATAGFRGYRKEVFQKIDLKKIISDGYSFQVELIYLVNKAGFKIKEVPIIFPDRKLGQSKIGQQEIIKAIIIVLKLRFRYNIFNVEK